MALVKCYECKREVSDRASSCPHCGAPLQQPSAQQNGKQIHQKRKWGTVVGLVVIVLILISICVIGFVTTNNNRIKLEQAINTIENPTTFGREPISDSETIAMNEAETIVRDRLKSPTTAEFPKTKILGKQGRKIWLYLEVDAQNSFGAMIRSSFWVILSVDGDRCSYDPRICIIELSSATSEELDIFMFENGWR